MPDPWGKLPERADPKYYDKAMTAGNKLREQLGQNNALAGLAIARIRDVRELERKKLSKNQSEVTKPVAYVLSSLKRPEEVELLRLIYGPTFFAIAAYSPRVEKSE